MTEMDQENSAIHNEMLIGSEIAGVSTLQNNYNVKGIQHLVHVAGYNITFEITVQSLFLKGEQFTVPYDVSIHDSNALLLLNILGYKSEGIEFDASKIVKEELDRSLNHDGDNIATINKRSHVKSCRENRKYTMKKKSQIPATTHTKRKYTRKDKSAAPVTNDDKTVVTESTRIKRKYIKKTQTTSPSDHNSSGLLLMPTKRKYNKKRKSTTPGTNGTKSDIKRTNQNKEQPMSPSDSNRTASISAYAPLLTVEISSASELDIKAELQEQEVENKTTQQTDPSASIVEDSTTTENVSKVKQKKCYTCTKCGDEFSKVMELRNHRKTHVGRQTYMCSFCGANFKKGNSLKEHIKIHTGSKPHICIVCNTAFTQKGSLTTHMRVHTGERSFLCPICGDAFGYKSVLATHMRKHTGDRPFVCTVCGSRFKQQSNLNNHLKTHSIDKPYKCLVCPYTCKYSDVLKEHSRRHTGEKPFKCTECTYMSVTGKGLKRHMMRQHSQITDKCHSKQESKEALLQLFFSK